MVYDDIIVGSGLTALGVALGLPAGRRVLLVTGPNRGITSYYDPSNTAPCAHLGYGGLGNYWHGVIPTDYANPVLGEESDAFRQLLDVFYPGLNSFAHSGGVRLFVPWRPIRPQRIWPKVGPSRGIDLQRLEDTAVRVLDYRSSAALETVSGRYSARRLWLCCGPLHTPGLLDRSLSVRVSRETVSDHVVCYVGQIDRKSSVFDEPPAPQLTSAGVLFGARHNLSGTGLFTLRPARFAFRNLDYGIEQRAAFGLPTGGVVSKVIRAASPGLVLEAIYNRTGLFPGARIQSIYAQLVVADAYWWREGGQPLSVRTEIIRAAMDEVRATVPWADIVPSRRAADFIPAIHIHHSVDQRRLWDQGVNLPDSAVQVADASAYERIGPDHHSFRIMAAAFARARGIQ